MKQTTFASPAFDSKNKLTRRERFLAEMDQVVPWMRLLNKFGTLVDATLISTRGIVHTVTTTTAKEADITQLPELLYGKESVVLGGSGLFYSADANANAWIKKRGVLAPAETFGFGPSPDRNRENAQPTLIEGEGVRRASLPYHQAVVGLRQSPLPGPGQEHGPGVRAAGAG